MGGLSVYRIHLTDSEHPGLTLAAEGAVSRDRFHTPVAQQLTQPQTRSLGTGQVNEASARRLPRTETKGNELDFLPFYRCGYQIAGNHMGKGALAQSATARQSKRRSEGFSAMTSNMRLKHCHRNPPRTGVTRDVREK